MGSGFSASVSGINAAFLKQSVKSDNLANLNTSGFKVSDAQQVSDGVTGTRVSSIDLDTSQGPLLRTNRPTDLAIEGEGFFVVEQDGQQAFTRSGSLGLDGNGRLVDQVSGGIVQGIDGGRLEPIRLGEGTDRTVPVETDSIQFSGNLSSELEPGETENIAVDLTNSQGAKQSVVLEFEKTGVNQFRVTAQDSQTGNTALRANLSFDGSGNLKTVDVQDSPNTSDTFEGLFLEGKNGSDSIEIGADGLNFEDLTQQAGESTVRVANVEGRSAGSLSSFSVNETGQVIGRFSNGERREIGQVALANFENPGGLETKARGLLTPSANSGPPQFGPPGTGNRGTVRSGVLEGSNADMVNEFTEMLSERSSLEANVNATKVQQEMLGSLLDLTQ